MVTDLRHDILVLSAAATHTLPIGRPSRYCRRVWYSAEARFLCNICVQHGIAMKRIIG